MSILILFPFQQLQTEQLKINLFRQLKNYSIDSKKMQELFKIIFRMYIDHCLSKSNGT